MEYLPTYKIQDQDSDYEDETTISEAIDNEVDQLKSEENSESETSDVQLHF